MASRRQSEPKSRSKPVIAAPPAKPVTAPPTPTAAAPAPAPKKRAAPKPKPAATTPRPIVTEDVRRGMIAEAAYLRAERRGFAPGGEHEDWMLAEAEVDKLLSADPAAPQ